MKTVELNELYIIAGRYIFPVFSLENREVAAVRILIVLRADLLSQNQSDCISRWLISLQFLFS